MKVVSISLPPSLLTLAKQAARSDGFHGLSGMVRFLLLLYMQAAHAQDNKETLPVDLQEQLERAKCFQSALKKFFSDRATDPPGNNA